MPGGGSAKADFTFGEPMNLVSPVNSAHAEYAPSISADGLSLYFGSNRPGGEGGYDIWVTTRETKDDEWGTPMNLGAPVNSSDHEAGPNISADGLSIYFLSTRPGGSGAQDLWVATRETVNAPWNEPVNLAPTVNSPFAEIRPAISADGLSLYFSDHSDARPGGYGRADLWVTTRETVDAPWNEPMNMGPTVNSSRFDARPCISSDGLTLLFDSNRDGGYGRFDLYMTKRASLFDPWGTPVNIGPPVNSPIYEEGSSISPDGSTLYFCSPDRPGGHGDLDIWQAKFVPIVDLNGDGTVDSADMVIMVDHWGEDYPLCDIGPMPWGDGVVDVEDLKVLAEYLFTYPGTTAYWKLDEMEGDIAYDSAHGYDGVLIGGPIWRPDGGMMDGALHFDGIDDFVGTDFVLDPAHNLFSVFSWIKGGAPGQVVISQADGVNWLSADPSEGKLMTSLSCPPGGRVLVPAPLVSESVITDDTWHCIGFVWDGLCRTLYVDGTEVAKDPVRLSGLESAEGSLYFGVGSNLAPNTFFSGLIDDVCIYNRVLSP